MVLKKYVIAAVVMFACALSVNAHTPTDSVKTFSWRVRAAVRARWENDFDLNRSRFQLRNARIILDGDVYRTFDYFLQADLCDRGTMKFLDAWARMEVFDGFRVQVGQFRLPFGVEPFRAPGTYIFSNRSYIGKYVCNVRAVGGKVMYTLPTLPLTVKGGIFNPTSIFEQMGWNSSYAYAGRAVFSPGNWHIEGGVMSMRPDGVRVNLLDAACGWFSQSWDLAAEYMYEHYTNETHLPTHAYALWGDYKMPVKVGMFNQLSFQGRFDGMTAHSNGRGLTEGKLPTDDPSRNRVTIGATLSCLRGNLGLDIRADYEKAFYRSGVDIPGGEGDRLVLELVLRF